MHVSMYVRMVINQGLSQDFHNRASKLGFQEFGCPKSLTEKVKIITMITYIKK